ncbi:hypothetical protein [Collinsella sp. LCP19S3_B11]|uniref:hypothetical protein n=1 Tax=Collinsella sp. LCP19S3_B11 TaxID=3438754 RepID=UPI003F927B00
MRDAREVRALMIEARAWAENNPEAWAYIERRAMEEAGAQRRVSVSRLVEEVRALEWTPRDGGRFKVNNSYQAAFSRMLAETLPEVRPYIEQRRSRFDGVAI